MFRQETVLANTLTYLPTGAAGGQFPIVHCPFGPHVAVWLPPVEQARVTVPPAFALAELHVASAVQVTTAGVGTTTVGTGAAVETTAFCVAAAAVVVELAAC